MDNIKMGITHKIM